MSGFDEEDVPLHGECAAEITTIRAQLAAAQQDVERLREALLDTRKGEDEGPCWCPSPSWRNATHPNPADPPRGEHCTRPGQNCKMYRAALASSPPGRAVLHPNLVAAAQRLQAVTVPAPPEADVEDPDHFASSPPGEEK